MDILIIFLAIIINAFFAMSEIGVVSANKNHLQKLADNGGRRAQRALALIAAPSRFLSTVQIGITFSGILGAIYGGAGLARRMEPLLVSLFGEGNWFYENALIFSEGFVALLIGVTSIVFGELVPKRFALAYPNKVAVGVAGFMERLSVMTAPLIYVLSSAADAVLCVFGIRKNPDTQVSEDEVRVMIRQGMDTGVFHETERDLVEAVFDLDNLRAGNLMTPKNRVVALNLAESEEIIRRKIAASGHSDFPVCDGTDDKILGMVSVKALWANLSLTGSAEIRNLLTEPLTVPLNLSVTRLLEIFKKERRRTALVTDEYGTVLGLVSLKDVMESIVGAIPGELPQHDNLRAEKQIDGTWVLEGLTEIGDVKDTLKIGHFPSDDTGAYHTLAGFLLLRLGVIPKGGEKISWNGFTFEILTMDRTRIDKVRVTPPPVETKTGD